MEKYKILIAEDDRKLNEGIALALRREDIVFVQCFSVREIERQIEKEIPDLMILDINFPDGSGLGVLRKLRKEQITSKIILLTANNMETDIVTGLELGADDYITKPFSLMVLRARVNVQLRSLDGQKTAGADGEAVATGCYMFDFEKMLFRAGERMVELSKTEQRLLRMLVMNRGITMRREVLIDEVWNGDSEYVDEHALTVTVKRLRDKLRVENEKEPCIRTVYGLGYTWTVE